MLSWTRYLSFRYLFTHNGRRGHLGNTLAALGLCIGIMTLITVLTVMNGFQQSFITSINEVYSYHIRISNMESDDDLSYLKEYDGIRAVVAFTDLQGILTSRQSYSSGAQMRILDFEAALEDKGFFDELEIIAGSVPEKENEILLGTSLARYLGAKSGELISFSRLDPRNSSFKSTDYIVSGIFSTGYYEYDRNMCFASLSSTQGLLLNRGVKLDNHFRDKKVLSFLRNEFPEARIESWREYNSAFFNALKIEKVFMFLIVALIFIVVAVNIYHSMKRNVKERILELALLKAVGGRASDIRKIYINQGVMIALISMISGTLAGIALSLNVNEIISFIIGVQQNLYLLIIRIPFVNISAPGEFYFTEVPVKFFLKDILIINIAAFVSVLFAAVSSVYTASKVLPAEIFRNE
jgi:lipoprotein-releasing system permease protein